MSRTPADDLDWNLVRTFISVVDTGSLAGAARLLKLAHPTVARHVQQLESQLGIALFERSATGLKINESGARLADAAAGMRQNALAIESTTQTLKNASTGRVRVTVAEVFADLIPELLLPLRSESGGRHIELVVSPRSLNLLEQEADVAIRHVRPAQSELVCRRVGALPMGAWASAEYIARHGRPTLETLGAHWFVDGAMAPRFSESLARLGYPIDKEQIVFRTDSLQAQRRAAEMGWGIVGMPNYLGARTLGLERVCTESTQRVELDIWIVARPAVRQQKLLKMVFERLGENLRGLFGAPEIGQSEVPAG